MNPILQYIRENDAAKRAWSPELLDAWVRWFSHQKYFFINVNKIGQIRGILLLRPLATKEQYLQDYSFDCKGKVAGIDLAIFSTKKAARKLVREAIARIGFKRTIVFERNKNKRGLQSLSTGKTLQKLKLYELT